MFWLTCDTCQSQCDFGEWFLSAVIARCLDEGWKVTGNGKRATCPECLDAP